MEIRLTVTGSLAVKATGVPAGFSGRCWPKCYDTARDERNGFDARPGGFVQTSIRVSVASLCGAFVHGPADLNGLIQANRTAATVKGEAFKRWK
jgi:hypothetical protein